MLHKISELCDKVNVLKVKADKLRKDSELKEEGWSIPTVEIEYQVADIQSICNLIANDKT
jgi:hypothetical protein|tara:strand:- start:658 stop:837 length:180 start_codon:yes stop_codon:yes gene_type:complete